MFIGKSQLCWYEVLVLSILAIVVTGCATIRETVVDEQGRPITEADVSAALYKAIEVRRLCSWQWNWALRVHMPQMSLSSRLDAVHVDYGLTWIQI
jgi:hypothetical protein